MAIPIRIDSAKVNPKTGKLVISGANNPRRQNKYGNTKVEIDGHNFDSKAESRRYLELKLLEKAGKIMNLWLQPKFELVPKTKKRRAVTYVADFMYREHCGNTCPPPCGRDNCGIGVTVVEDVKSEATAKDKAYVIKRNLFEYQNPDIDFREIVG